MMVEKFDFTAVVLYDCTATLYPVTGVVIGNFTHGPDGWVVNVATEHAMHFGVFGVTKNGLFKVTDKIHHVLYFVFDVGTQRPVIFAQLTTTPVDPSIEPHQHFITHITNMGQLTGIANDGVHFVSVHYENAATVRSRVDIVFQKSDVSKIPEVLHEKFIMIARDVYDFCPLPSLSQQFLHYIIVALRPVNAPLQCPDVDDVTDKVELLTFIGFDKIQQCFSLASFRAQMNIGNPHCTVLFHRKEKLNSGKLSHKPANPS